MVLGVSWLSTLGPIVWDFSQSTMEFSWKTHKISLKGIEVGGLTVDSCDKVLISIAVQPTHEPLPGEIQHLLDQFKGVFETPTGLSPPR